jgi:hypothetical protein
MDKRTNEHAVAFINLQVTSGISRRPYPQEIPDDNESFELENFIDSERVATATDFGGYLTHNILTYLLTYFIYSMVQGIL